MIRTVLKILFTILAIITEGIIGYQMLILPVQRFFSAPTFNIFLFLDTILMSLAGIVVMSLLGSAFVGILVFITYFSGM